MTKRSPLLIAEIGSNHLGNMARAAEMLTSVLAAGAHGILLTFPRSGSTGQASGGKPWRTRLEPKILWSSPT